MIEPRGEGWRPLLASEYPGLTERIGVVRQWAMRDGALPAKTKALMALLCDAMRDRFQAVPILARTARELGATEDEIKETLDVAFWLGGVYALSAGAEALRQ